jgi:hypothetical protein
MTARSESMLAGCDPTSMVFTTVRASTQWLIKPCNAKAHQHVCTGHLLSRLSPRVLSLVTAFGFRFRPAAKTRFPIPRFSAGCGPTRLTANIYVCATRAAMADKPTSCDITKLRTRATHARDENGGPMADCPRTNLRLRSPPQCGIKRDGFYMQYHTIYKENALRRHTRP